MVVYLIGPFVCALIGWFTNYLAIKMLFHPREPKKILFITFHGIFPKRRAELAVSLGEMVENNLISHDDVQGIILDDEFADKFKNMVEVHVMNFIERKLVSLHPMVQMFLNESMIAKIRGILKEELDEVIPKLLDESTRELEDKLVFKDIVRKKVESFSIERIEDMLFSVMKKEFKFIEVIGGVLGFVIGVVQSLIFYLAS
jgi:uncharacterized membrane protein YheB (UPF0754 family)